MREEGRAISEPDPPGLGALRPARWWDIAALVAMDAELFGVDAWSAATFWSELAGVPDRRWYAVAEEFAPGGSAQIVGYAGLGVAGDTADVQTIAVRGDRQGLGWGAVLLGALCAQARARGAAQVLLEVRADNDAALALYAGAGFEVIHTRRRYYADAADAVIMRAGLGTEIASDST